MTEPTSRGHVFRNAINGFIEARREAKLKGKDDDHDAGSKYDYASWLADAAKRVSQIEMITHVLKATNPNARGTSLYVLPTELPSHAEIGTHTLGDEYVEDVTGNAGALDVFKFLKTEVEGRRLLDWMQAGDVDLLSALSADEKEAREWMLAFASLLRKDGSTTSHTLAKQVYWLVGDEPQDDVQYHLLQPMFSSSLAQAVHTDIQQARFGEANTAARQAFRNRTVSEFPYHDYRDLVANKLGGTKPQTVSQLNSERRGVNYLLPSLPPPAWVPDEHANLLQRDSALEGFLWFEDTRQHLRALTDYLLSVQDETSTMAIRDNRDRLSNALAQQFALYGSAVRARHAPGWSRDETSKLPRCEQLWLDAERSELPVRDDPAQPQWKDSDEAFNAEYTRGDWADEVATRFGLWLNQRLRDKGLVTMAEPELRQWAREAVLDVAWPVPMQRNVRGGEA